VIVIKGPESSLQAQSSAGGGGSAIDAKRLVSLLLPPLAVMAMIFVLSAQTSDSHDRALWEVLLRKLAHVTEYTVLTLVWLRAVASLLPTATPASVYGVAAALSLAYAASDEFHQTFVAGRSGRPVDVLIDAIGVVLACVLTQRYARRRRTAGPSRPRAA
jgi:VanZ family protein